MKNDKMKAYASYFVSYLLKGLDNLSNVNMIILFGSVAKGNAGKESDVDIFVDVKRKNKKFEKDVRVGLESFYKSGEALSFKVKGVDNKINVIVGKLGEWKGLEKSIESTSIVLYGNYVSQNVKGRKYSIIYWSNVKRNRGAFLNKLYGFSVKGKRYKGLIENFGGKKLGKSNFMVPVECRDEVSRLLKKYGVNARILEVYM